MSGGKVIAALEKKHAQQEGPKRPMRVNRRGTDEKVTRILKAHFSSWSVQDTDTTVRGRLHSQGISA